MPGRTAIAAVSVACALAASAGARAERVAAVGTVSVSDVRVPGEHGLDHFGRGVGATISFLDPRPEPFVGYEFETRFVLGEDDERLYQLGASLLAGPRATDRFVAPFVSVGLDVAAIQRAEANADDRGVLVGVHGAIGLHGLKDTIYWRLSGGYLGAVGGLYAQVGLGFAFGGL